jgi:hypothetical protein
MNSNRVKPFLFRILCLFFSAAQSVLAIETIQPPDALKHAGEEVYVEGVVASVHATPKGVAFIKAPTSRNLLSFINDWAFGRRLPESQYQMVSFATPMRPANSRGDS